MVTEAGITMQCHTPTSSTRHSRCSLLLHSSRTAPRWPPISSPLLPLDPADSGVICVQLLNITASSQQTNFIHFLIKSLEWRSSTTGLRTTLAIERLDLLSFLGTQLPPIHPLYLNHYYPRISIVRKKNPSLRLLSSLWFSFVPIFSSFLL